MFRALSPSVFKDLREQGTIVLTIKRGWESAGAWSAKPCFVNYCIGNSQERIFSCYMSFSRKAAQVTNITPTELISSQKSLIDGYLYIALTGIERYMRAMRMKRLVVDSCVPCMVDHLVDLGFEVTVGDKVTAGRKVLGFKKLN